MVSADWVPVASLWWGVPQLQKVIISIILSEEYYIKMVQFSIIMELLLNIGKKIMDSVKQFYLDIILTNINFILFVSSETDHLILLFIIDVIYSKLNFIQNKL